MCMYRLSMYMYIHRRECLLSSQPELRGSLVLSILHQMLTEDKAESVRQAVCRSLAVLVAFTDDNDKFKQVRRFGT